MRLLACVYFLTILGVSPAFSGTEAQAKAVRKAYETENRLFAQKLKMAPSHDARQKLMVEEAPDATEAAKAMWQVIRTELDEEWVIEPASWYLRLAHKEVKPSEKGQMMRVFEKEISTVQEAVEKHHLKSMKLAPMCLALVTCSDKKSMELLRMIEAQNPHDTVSGVAALGIAMLAKNLGDEPRIMQERISMIRKAIVKSADVTVDGISMAKLAEEELYIIMNLSKDRIAPDFEGSDSGGRSMKLSDYSGKVVMLIFWNTMDNDASGLIQWVKALRKDDRFAGKEFVVVGVNNNLRTELRTLQADGKVDWPNFSDPQNKLAEKYRLSAWPTCYVLGPDRKIHYIGNIGPFAELTAAALLSES